MYLYQHYPQYFTSTCLEWNYLLKQDRYKDKISKDLKWLVDYHWIKVYAFVIMPNHLHYIGHVHPTLNYSKVKGGHLRNTSQKIKHDLLQNKEEKLFSQFYIGAKNRAYQH